MCLDVRASGVDVDGVTGVDLDAVADDGQDDGADPPVSVRTLALLSFLDPDEREMLVDHVVVGRSLKQIGASHGLSGEAVRLVERRAALRLRDIVTVERMLRDDEQADMLEDTVRMLPPPAARLVNRLFTRILAVPAG